MTTVVVTGVASALGLRVCALVAADPSVDRVLALDLRSPGEVPAGVEVRAVDLATAELKPFLEGAEAVIHLASVFGPSMDGPEIEAGVQVAMARRVLDAAGDASVPAVVIGSSATVYGAWGNNPVPITEDAPTRPCPDLTYAVHEGEVERLALEWREEHPDATVCLLRPCPVVGDGSAGWLARALDRASTLVAASADDPPMQYLHLDDLASAVNVARRHRLDGPVNVAPDGWLTGTERRALDPAPRLRLPDRLVSEVASWRWRLRLAPIPPGLLAYVRHPWVVANDRLRAAGWAPTFSNEEAYVAGHDAGPIEKLSPRRRQELALGAAAGVVVAAGIGGVAAIRRARRS
jgi:nucleoside-diphosphate-sugar epimerase